MSKKLLKRLALERKRRIEEARLKLLMLKDIEEVRSKLSLQRDFEPVEKTLTWIDAYSKLIQSSRQSSILRWSIFISIVCLILVVLAWSLRLTPSYTNFQIKSKTVYLSLATDWYFDQWNFNNYFKIRRISIDNLTSVETSTLFPPPDTNSDLFRFTLFGDSLSLDRLYFSEDAIIQFELSSNILVLNINNAKISGSLSYNNAHISLSGNDFHSEDSVSTFLPETVYFENNVTQIQPTKIEIELENADWKIQGMQTKEINFLEEYPSSSGKFISSIRSGFVNFKIWTSDFEKEIHDGEVFKLSGIVSRNVSISRDRDDLLINFDGNVDRILIGPLDFETNVSPTYLDFITQHQPVAVFWSSLVFLIGLLWNIRKVFFN